MSKLKQLTELCKNSVHININQHRDYYETIKEHIDEEEIERIDSNVLAKMIELDTCVKLYVYPNNATTSYMMYHYDVDKVIEMALEQILEDKKQFDLMATKCRTSSSAIYRYIHELLYKDKI